MSEVESGDNARSQVVRSLRRLLDQAERGEITSFAAVTFKPNGGIAYSSEFTERRDIQHAGQHIDRLREQVLDLASWDK